MAAKRLVWVDVGMAVAVGCFVAIVAFARTSEAFVPLMVAFSIALIAWAFVAEYAMVRAETAELGRRQAPTTRAPAQPLPH